MTAFLLDDEQHSINVLKLLLEKYCQDVEILATCTDSEEGLSLIRQLKPDLIFLDIEMPRMSGFHILEALGDQRIMIIFTTAYDKYAVRAFKFSAVDYLLKPVEPAELVKAVAKASERQRMESHQLEILGQQLEHRLPSLTGKIALSRQTGFIFVEIDSIILVEGEGNYSNVYVSDNKKMLITKAIGEVEEVLSTYPFYRIHRKYLINLRYIQEYIRGDGGYLIMENDVKVPIARSRREEFNRLFAKL